jgi:hypothetical protein
MIVRVVLASTSTLALLSVAACCKIVRVTMRQASADARIVLDCTCAGFNLNNSENSSNISLERVHCSKKHEHCTLASATAASAAAAAAAVAAAAAAAAAVTAGETDAAACA